MYQINLNNPCKVFFIGIGGISMSGFAQLLHENGFNVCGSDMKESKITDHLESLGINIIYGQKTENITADIDFVVYTAAIHPDNPEFVRAKELGIPMMESWLWETEGRLSTRRQPALRPMVTMPSSGTS